jgi:hypothetical protein
MLDEMLAEYEQKEEVKQPQQNEYQQSKQSGGYNNWKKKEEEIREPYVPISVFIDREFPQEVKDQIYRICSKLISKKYTVRINGDDKPLVDRIKELSSKHLEIYTPWKNFNEYETKSYYNNESSKNIAKESFLGWEKVPDAVKAFLARNVRMIFGDKITSPCLCLVTWSPDSAHLVSEVSQKTGKASFIIKLAATYGFPVINLARKEAENILDKNFHLV